MSFSPLLTFFNSAELLTDSALFADLPLQPDDLFKSSSYRASSYGDEDDGTRNEAVKMLKIAFGRWGKMGRRGVRLTGLREEIWVRGVGEKQKSLAGVDSVSLCSCRSPFSRY